METILKDINAIVGVTGAFVCDDEGQILARLMPNVFDTNLLSPVGRTMAQTIAGLKIARRRKVGDVDLLYDQGRLIVKSLDEGYLCILCACRINVPLLNLTANVAVKKLGQRIKELRAIAAFRSSPLRR
jgi:predicted regulator of Ras-like GTPase activity (Roadblock/LC7/MglB family)